MKRNGRNGRNSISEIIGKRIFFTLLISVFFGSALVGQTVVFPFKVSLEGAKGHQWLGRAVSYYVTTGLALNGAGVIPDNEVVDVLIENKIVFPYSMSKATALKLAITAGADKLVWGEILPYSEDMSILKVSAFVLDLKNYSQEYLPFFKGDIDALYQVQEELLKSVLQVPQVLEKRPNDEIRYPEFRLKNHNYEVFIKSLLVTDVSQKVKMLENVFQQEQSSDFLNIELAESYLQKGNAEKTSFYLDKVSDDVLFKDQKEQLIEKLNQQDDSQEEKPGQEKDVQQDVEQNEKKDGNTDQSYRPFFCLPS